MRLVLQSNERRGADLNCTDRQFGATPAGWATEYLRESGGYLAIDLDDLAYAVQRGEARRALSLLFGLGDRP
jgi:hypothetical protein